ncbi:MAG TPA: alkaline phosphatase family protein, partial [Ktedonobacterales bacterium]|nr:alkaline phosphatase family protein [Ktedonobacterales bacterium]
MRIKRVGVLAGVVAAVVVASASVVAFSSQQTSAAAPTHATSGVPRYQHIFYIMMENHSYDEVIGNAAAPQINALASEYGLATDYWGVTHPSEPNYVASVAGSNYNVVNDSPYQAQLVQKPYLGSQLEAAGLTWKTYQQSLPSVGFTGNYWPSST